MHSDERPSTPTHPDPVLRAILQGRAAWSSDASLRREHGEGALSALHAEGWIAPWTIDLAGRPVRPRCWTLTSWAAAEIGVELDERPCPPGEDAGVPYWVESGDASGPFLCRTVPGQVRIRFPERVPDPRPAPGVEYLVDVESGATTEDPELAAKVLGVPARIDPRLGKKRRPPRTGAGRGKSRVNRPEVN
jgi:hypothetical protein